MQKQEHKESNTITYTMGIDEQARLKRLLIIGGTGLVLSVGIAAYSAFSMGSLRAENELYRNQLKMANQKIEALEEKTENLEKIGNQLQEMVNGTNGQATTYGGGTGGASTVPDKAESVSVKERTPAKAPGEMLKNIHTIDTRLNKELKLFLSLRESIMTHVYGAVGSLIDENASMPNRWPVLGAISSGFGFRESPGGIGSTYHEGVDIAGDYGVPIEATAAGTVTKAGWMDGYGYMVEIRHEGGMVTRYGHNSSNLVYEGQQVSQGQTIALMGSTGNSTGPHCHYEVRVNGEAVNPVYFLP